jgi:hypothetical protein
MTNPSKSRGDRAERDAVAWLRANGHPHAERIRAGWQDDRGDIDGIPGLVIEVKSARTPRWQEWLDELDVEMVNAGCSDGIVLWKPPGCGDPGRWLAVRRLTNEMKDNQ